MMLTPSCRQSSVTDRFADSCRASWRRHQLAPKFATHGLCERGHDVSPETASDAVRGQTTRPGDDSSAAASHEVRGQATMPGKAGSVGTYAAVIWSASLPVAARRREEVSDLIGRRCVAVEKIAALRDEGGAAGAMA